MPRAPAILIADCSASDTDLAELLLRRGLPTAEIRVANDAVAFAEALAAQTPQVAIVAPRLTWAPSDKLIALLRRHDARTRVVLFGHEADILEQGLSPGLAIDGIARKSSAGYLALAGIVSDVLERDGALPASSATAPSSTAALTLDTLPLPAFLLADDGRVTNCNEALSRALEMERGALLGAPFEQLLADGEALAQWHGYRAGTHELPTRFRLRGPASRPLAASVRRLQDGAGLRFMGCVESSAEAPVLPTSVAKPAAGEPAAQEMRDIALVFSHDLKEPVQQIARIARRGEEGGDSASRGRAIQQIQECAQRASGMLDSMLEYLTVSARDGSPVPVDLNNAFEQARDNLRGLIDEADAQVSADHLPVVQGDEYQMLHLFQNLLGNAIKFRGRERPEIRVTVEPQGDDWLVAVRDNGIGIPQPFLQRVFDMGQRLHTRDEYPGTGVGLALCKRIVERHGGRIWVTSNEGAGCTFFVRLPQAPADAPRQP